MVHQVRWIELSWFLMCAYAFLLRQSTRNIAATWYCEMANGHTPFVRPRRRCQEMWIIGGTCWEKNYKNNTCPFNFQTKSKYVEHGIEWERDSSIAIWSYNELTVCDIWIVALEWRNLNQARHHIRNLARYSHCLPRMCIAYQWVPTPGNVNLCPNGWCFCHGFCRWLPHSASPKWW